MCDSDDAELRARLEAELERPPTETELAVARDEDFIERVIQTELKSESTVTELVLRALRNKLLLTFHPDKYEDDTRYVDVILKKLSPDSYWRYLSSIPIVPTYDPAALQNALSAGISEALTQAFLSAATTSTGLDDEGSAPLSAESNHPFWNCRTDIDVYSSDGWTRRTVQHQIGRKVFWSTNCSCDVSATRRHLPCKLVTDHSKNGHNLYCEKAAGHNGGCSVTNEPRKRRKVGVSFHVDLREALRHAFVQSLIENVFLPRHKDRPNALHYGRQMRLILSNAHPLSSFLPQFEDNMFISNLFVEWSNGFKVWSNAIPSEKKRGNRQDPNGTGHAALHAIFDFSKTKIQVLFDNAVSLVG